jgi:uncharacterized delta-60 repeat protein
MRDRLRRLAFGAGIASLSSAFAPGALGATGDFDTTFGSVGYVSTEVTSRIDFANDVAIQPDGFIVVAGTGDVGGSDLLAVARYAPDGSLDASFGAGGFATTDQLGPWLNFASLALQSDGRIVVAATVRIPFPLHFGVVRWNSDGTLDTTFGSGGATSVDLDSVGGMAVQADGRIVVAGDHFNGSDADFALARFEADGTLDATFGVGGVVTTDLTGDSDNGLALGLQSDGGIVVAGQVWTDSLDLGVVRYASDGALDGTFGTSGVVITDLEAVARVVVVQPDGKILVGFETLELHPDAGLIRYEPDGVLDESFGVGGIVITDWNQGGTDGFGDMALQPDGRIVAVGAAEYAMPDSFVLAVARYEADGSLDSSFGAGGISLHPGSSGFAGFGVALQPDGRIVLAGPPDFTAGRLLGDCGNGTVDTGEDCDDGNVLDGDCCSSACAQAPDGAPCADSDACTTGATCGDGSCGSPVVCEACESCDSEVGCVGAPRPGGTCKVSTRPGGRLLLRDGASDSADRLLWKWRNGEATLPAELGDPLSGDGYTLCVFDESVAAATVLASARAPGEDGSCGARSCWKGVGQPPGSDGFRYRDKARTPDGLQSLRVKPGDDGEASFVVKGKGGLLDLGPLPANEPLEVKAQLSSDDGACFEASFSASGVLRNDAEWLELRSD